MTFELIYLPIQFLIPNISHNTFEFENIFIQNLSLLVLHLQLFSLTVIPSYATVSLSIISGTIVGFSLGLIGGGGSIFAVPLLVYVIGLEPHVAIGTSAFAVAVNALINLLYHKKKGHVFFKKGILFAIPGVIGTVIGSQLGLLTPANSLLILLALFMVAIAIKMLIEKNNTKKKDDDNDDKKSIVISKDKSNKNINKEDNKKNQSLDHRDKNLQFMIIGFLVGLGAGYFGIGGGFLIVPSLVYLGLNIVDAIGTSLLPVSIFGFTTAAGYSIFDQIDWIIALLFITGGIAGGKAGSLISSKLSNDKLSKVFSLLLIVVAIYIIIKTIS